MGNNLKYVHPYARILHFLAVAGLTLFAYIFLLLFHSFVIIQFRTGFPGLILTLLLAVLGLPILIRWTRRKVIRLAVINDFVRRRMLKRNDGIVVIDPDKFDGQPFLAGTTVTVAYVLGLMSQGFPSSAIIEKIPGLTEEHIRACLAWRY